MHKWKKQKKEDLEEKRKSKTKKTDSKVETSVVTETSLEFKTTQTPKRTFGNDWRRKLVSKDERVARGRNKGYRRRKSYDRKEQDPWIRKHSQTGKDHLMRI